MVVTVMLVVMTVVVTGNVSCSECDGDGQSSCNDCDGNGSIDCAIVMVTVRYHVITVVDLVLS
jgi:DnaJ-class molecular chaperone